MEVVVDDCGELVVDTAATPPPPAVGITPAVVVVRFDDEDTVAPVDVGVAATATAPAGIESTSAPLSTATPFSDASTLR